MSTKSTTPAATKNVAPIVEATTPVVPAKPVIVATGSYGVDGNRIPMATVKNNCKLTNKMAGNDPAPKVVKNAIITYSIDGGEQKEITVLENEKIVMI